MCSTVQPRGVHPEPTARASPAASGPRARFTAAAALFHAPVEPKPLRVGAYGPTSRVLQPRVGAWAFTSRVLQPRVGACGLRSRVLQLRVGACRLTSRLLQPRVGRCGLTSRSRRLAGEARGGPAGASPGGRGAARVRCAPSACGRPGCAGRSAPCRREAGGEGERADGCGCGGRGRPLRGEPPGRGVAVGDVVDAPGGCGGRVAGALRQPRPRRGGAISLASAAHLLYALARGVGMPPRRAGRTAGGQADIDDQPYHLLCAPRAHGAARHHRAGLSDGRRGGGSRPSAPALWLRRGGGAVRLRHKGLRLRRSTKGLRLPR